MSDNQQFPAKPPEPEGRQPIFLLPGVVTALVGLMVAIHLASVFVFDEDTLLRFTVWLGFIPYRLLDDGIVPGGVLPLAWTLFTHAFLHAGIEHLAVNTAWLAIFATPVARRYGAGPTLAIFLLSAAAGALAFAATTLPSLQILVGASGGVAGLTGAAVRFMFQPVIIGRDPETGQAVVLGRRLARLGELMAETRPRAFILIWVLLNAAVPLLPALTGGEGIAIAWQAHLGGFFAGLLIVPLFERLPR